MGQTVGRWLKEQTALLQAAGIDSARLDCLILLEDLTGWSRSHILAHPRKIIKDTQLLQLGHNVAKRQQHTPLAYIRGTCEFYGHNFVVNEHVLVPRSETEMIAELAIAAAQEYRNTSPVVADIGCGSGCIGLSIALACPEARVILSDISPMALSVTQKNLEKYGSPSNVTIVTSDLLSGLPPADIMTANLPYVPKDYPVNQAASHEPDIALYSGDDGLDHYRALWNQIAELPKKPKHVITEALQEQQDSLTEIAKKAGYREVTRHVLSQHFIRSEQFQA